jgi:hypothetical protein
MAVEHEELRLSVTLNDQASAQLGNLQAALNNIGSAAGPAQQGLNSLAQSLKGAGGHAQQLHGSLTGMAAKGGFIGGFFAEIGKGAEKMAKDLANAVLNLKQYADEMTRLEVSASRAATSAAQFQRNVSTFRESGVSAADAAKNIEGFAAALGDLQREQSNIRSTLFAGLNPNEMAAMEQHLQRLQRSDRETAMQEAKQFGIRIRQAFEAEGKAERGAVAQKEYYRLLGMPDLDKLRDPFEKITPQLQQMYSLRMANAGRMQTAVEKTADASWRGVRSVQASALYILPVTEAVEGVGIVVESIAHWIESWEGSLDSAGDALINKDFKDSFWYQLAVKLGLQGTRTREDELNEQFGPAGPSQNIPLPPTMPRTRRLPLQLPGEAAPQQFTSGSGLGSDTGLGVGLGVGGAVDRLPAEYEEIGGRMIEDRREENATFPGRVAGDPVEDNTTEMEALANELRRLNDFLAPFNIMNPAFHNAPRGGARGESNPEKPPAGMKQPGGGAAAEAVRPITGDTPIATAMSEAMRYLERNESKDAAVLKDYMRTGGRNLTGDQNAWCARFVDAVQTRAGRPSLESSLPEGQRSGQKDDSTWSSLAYKNWGRGVTPDEDIREGDVFVKQRKGGGHVGVATGNYRVNAKGDKEYEMLSGNIGGAKKGGGEVNTTWETIGGRGGEKTAGAGHGGVVAVRRGEETTAVADMGPEEGGGKGKRLDPSAPPGSEFALGDNVAEALLPQRAVDDRFMNFGDDLPGMSFAQSARYARTRGRYLPESPMSTNVEDRRRIDLSGDPGGLEGTGDPGPFDPTSAGAYDLPGMEGAGGGYESWLGRGRTRTGRSNEKHLSEQLGFEAIPDVPLGAGFEAEEGQSQGLLGSGNGAGNFNDRFGAWGGGEDDWHKQATLAAAGLGPSASGRASPVGTDEQIWNAALTLNPYSKPLQAASGLAHSLSRAEGEDPFRGAADVMDRATSNTIDVSTSGLFSVNVNAPEGTSVKAEGSGMLSKTELSRSMPQKQMAENEEE